MAAQTLAWDKDELQAWLRLSLTPGVGSAGARKLLTLLGSPQAVFEAPVAHTQQCVSLAQAAQLRHVPDGFAQALENTWQWLHTSGTTAHALLAWGDPRYPAGLLQTADPPLLLYVMGPRAWLERPQELIDWQRSLAIVGSRNPTPQGQEHARQFAQHLGAQGWTIVSGMALGVDAAAHAGALAAGHAGIATVAVVGTGLDRVYPRQHKQLAHEIARQGLVVSEFPLGTPPVAANFPKRNRLISGLSRGTLVVEAALASGSLITARMAAEQGREVFAIPGSVHSPQARGCHALIRQGAKLVESAQDILEEFPQGAVAVCRETKAHDAATVPSGRALHPLLQALGHDPASLDVLAARTGWDAAHLQAQLMELELDGWLVRLPGGLYQRTAQA